MPDERPILHCWRLLICTLALLFGTPALAQSTHIAAELVAEGPAAPGQAATLAFVFQPEPGWHGYWANPGDAGFGMTLKWTLPAGTKAGALRYPVRETVMSSGLMKHFYEQA
jgi:DsbC/DsbD-like thiol-disulfide interchange protein